MSASASATDLTTLQYTFGDPRPIFLQWLADQGGVAVYSPSIVKATAGKKQVNLVSNECFHYFCNLEKNSRVLFKPKSPYLEKLKAVLAESDLPFVAIPLMMTSTETCSKRNTSRHMCVLLYNRVANEIDRLDIKRYSLKEFPMKILRTALERNVEETVIQKMIPGVTLAAELDVPRTYVERLGLVEGGSRAAFPLYLVHYVMLRLANPALTAKAVRAKLKAANVNVSGVPVMWKGVVDFYAMLEKGEKPCEDGVRKYETGRCIKDAEAYQVEKKAKECPEGKVYNALLNKCVRPSAMVDVDILMKESGMVDLGKVKKMDNVTHTVAISLGIMNHIMSKYPYARFVSVAKSKSSNKNTLGFQWIWDEEKGAFDLEVPTGFWGAFEAALNDTNVRFVIALVRLESKLSGVHANVMIYDKKHNELERFDGLGTEIHESYSIGEFDVAIEAAYRAHEGHLFKEPFKYFRPMDYCPRFHVFQRKEIADLPGEDLSGNCAVWRMWYIEMRLANPDVPRKKLVLLAAKKLEHTGNLHQFIKGYQAYLLASHKRLVEIEKKKKQEAKEAAAAAAKGA